MINLLSHRLVLKDVIPDAVTQATPKKAVTCITVNVVVVFHACVVSKKTTAYVYIWLYHCNQLYLLVLLVSVCQRQNFYRSMVVHMTACKELVSDCRCLMQIQSFDWLRRLGLCS